MNQRADLNLMENCVLTDAISESDHNDGRFNMDGCDVETYLSFQGPGIPCRHFV